MKRLKNKEPMRSWIGKIHLRCVFQDDSYGDIDVKEVIRWEPCITCLRRERCGTDHKRMVAKTDKGISEYCVIVFHSIWKWMEIGNEITS